MFNGFVRLFKELDRRVKVIALGTGMYRWFFTFPQQYNALYASALGVSPFVLGALSSVGRALNSIISIPAGWAADKYGLKKAILLGLALFAVSAGSYVFADDQRLIVPAIIFGSVSLVFPFTDIVIINYTAPQRRTMVMALLRTFWSVPNIFVPMIAAVIVANLGGITVQGVRPLYSIQLVLAIAIYLFVARKLQTPPAMSDGRGGGSGAERTGFIEDFREMFRGEKHLKKWIVLQATFWLSQMFSMPFIPLWMVNVKGADPYILGAMGTASRVMLAFLQIPVGRLADKIGRKKAFFLFRPITYLGTLLLILAPSPEYFVLVGLLGGLGMLGTGGGGIGGVSFLPFITMNFEMVSAQKRGRWRGITTIFNLINLPASIVGGILWQQGFMVEVLLLPLVIELCITIPLMVTVPDTLSLTTK